MIHYTAEEGKVYDKLVFPNGDKYAHVVTNTGGKNAYTATTSSNGVRPALILPSNALFDKNTLLLKGVA